MKINELREHDVLEIQREALIEAALVLKIKYPRFRDNLELRSEIKNRNIELHNAYVSFSSAYMNYFYFAKNLKIEKDKLSPSEFARLNDCENTRDDARQKFISLLEKVTI